MLLPPPAVDAVVQRHGQGWSMLRSSLGFIGILLPFRSLPSLRAFLELHYQTKPPDLLLVEWAHGNWPGSVRCDRPAVIYTMSCTCCITAVPPLPLPLHVLPLPLPLPLLMLVLVLVLVLPRGDRSV
eukprot:SAG22_NODE_6266_length_877_cov_1.539846_1_plen_127_part_00